MNGFIQTLLVTPSLVGSISGLILVLAIHFCSVLSNTFLKVIVWIIAVTLVLLLVSPIFAENF